MRADRSSPGFAARDTSIRFAELSWAQDVPGIRARETYIKGRRWAIVEYAAGARREEWCVDGHAGLVVNGSVEYEFEDGGKPLTVSTGDAFALATGRAHRGTNRAEGTTQLFVIDDPAA
jgi:quercetin dioxygenase-like cupin family protein